MKLEKRTGLYVIINEKLYDKFTKYCVKNNITKREATELALRKIMNDVPRLEYDLANIKL